MEESKKNVMRERGSLIFSVVFAISLLLMIFNMARASLISDRLTHMASGFSNLNSNLRSMASLISAFKAIATLHTFIGILIILGLLYIAYILYSKSKTNEIQETVRSFGFLTIAVAIAATIVASGLLATPVFMIKEATAILDGNLHWAGIPRLFDIGLEDHQFGALRSAMAFLLYALAFVMMVIYTLLGLVGRANAKTVEEAMSGLDTENLNKQSVELMEAATEAASAVAAIGAAGVSKANEVIKGIDKEEVMVKVDKNKKIIIAVIAAVMLVFIGVVGIKIGLYVIKPDAVVSLAGMKIEINVNGFDGIAKADTYVVGAPQILEIKNEKKANAINEAVYQYEVKLSKSDKIKNGDEITAQLEFPLAKGMKIKFDNEVLEKSKKVSDLPELVREFKDVKAHKDRMDKDAKKKLSSSYMLSDVKNLKIERVAIYDREITNDILEAEDLSGGYGLGDYYFLNMLYKVSGEREMIFSDDIEHFEKYALVSFGSFKKKDKALTYSIYNSHVYSEDETLENIDNMYILDGMEKISDK